MAASNKPKKSKGKGNRSLSHEQQHGPETAEEVLLRECGDVENTSKQSVLALKKAFEDISEKYRKSQTENKVLREKLEMGFKAFDDKYKETEQLKKELDLKEKEMTDKYTDTTEHQDINEESESLSTTLETNTEIPHFVEKNSDKSFSSISTQTYEEKTDEVPLPYEDYKDLLNSCGLEVVLHNDKVILMLTNRDDLKQWLENETDGKVSVAFEQTHVCERFIQTDDTATDDTTRNFEQEAMIIRLRAKISDQANIISKYRQTLGQLMPPCKSETPVATQITHTTAEKIIHMFKEYYQTILTRSQVAVNHIESLRKELEFQQDYCKHLLQIIKGTQPQEHFLLSIPNAPKQKLCEIKDVPEASSAESRSGKDVSHSKGVDDNASNDHLSMPVQVSDTQSQEGDRSASVVTIPESRSSSSEKSDQSSNRSKEHSSATSSKVKEIPAAAANSSKTRSSGSDRLPVPTPRSRLRGRSLSPPERNIDMQGVEVTSQDDDIVVINEEDRAMGDTSRIDIRAKECPVCFISFSPASSQEEFEAHVSGHFHD